MKHHSPAFLKLLFFSPSKKILFLLIVSCCIVFSFTLYIGFIECPNPEVRYTTTSKIIHVKNDLYKTYGKIKFSYGKKFFIKTADNTYSPISIVYIKNRNDSAKEIFFRYENGNPCPNDTILRETVIVSSIFLGEKILTDMKIKIVK